MGDAEKQDSKLKPGYLYSRAVIPSLLSLLIASCSSSAVVLMPDRFDTEVLPDGSKRFVFESSMGVGAGRAGGRGRAPSPADMESALESYFERFPFCEEGYFLYDQGYNGSAYTMLGECQESANRLAD